MIIVPVFLAPVMAEMLASAPILVVLGFVFADTATLILKNALQLVGGWF